MNRSIARALVVSALIIAAAAIAWRIAVQKSLFTNKSLATITIDYPAGGSIFPPEFPAPT